MTDHDADVAAVLAEALERFKPTSDKWSADRARVILAALTAAGIRCLYVPEGVAVAHGARLVRYGEAEWGLYNFYPAIEDTP